MQTRYLEGPAPKIVHTVLAQKAKSKSLCYIIYSNKMMMDWQTGLVWLGFVLISAAILLFISMVVTKEKSYEEAIAEQRQQASMLLGTQTKTKIKDKKQKKAGKKVKEKVQSVINDAETAEDSDHPDTISTVSADMSSSDPQIKHHVEFKEPQILEEPVKEIVKHKDEAIKPEHVPKEKPIKQKQNAAKNETNKTDSEPIEPKSNKKTAKHHTSEIVVQSPVEKEPSIEEAVVEKVNVVPQSNGFVSGANANGGKEKKKKKSEQNTIQQLAGDKQGVNLQILTTLVRKAELSRSEVQILIDMLLNKQHEAPAVIDEWSEGKADPVQKLKKQLAEKDKLLIEEQEALIGAQAKLKEVRAEQVNERSQLQQRLRGLEEALNSKQLELQATNNRMHGLNQKLQTLQTQINDEMMKNRKLLDDNNALQMHRQQIEIRVKQDDDVKETMQNDIRSLTEQFENQKALILHQQYELSQKDEVIKQLEEQRIDMERHLNINIIQDNECKAEIQQLKTACQQHIEEIRRLELNKAQSIGELKVQQEEHEKIMSQLNQELQRLKDENRDLEVCRENEVIEDKKTQVKIKNLQNELSSQLAVVERLQTELELQRDKNNELRKKNWKVMEALNEAENRNKKQTTINREGEIAAIKQQEQLQQKTLLERLFPNIKLSDSLLYDQWISQMECAIESYIKDLERPKTPEAVDNTEILKLQLQLQKNKQSLDEYDNLLNKLQKRTAQTEIEWRKEIEIKNAEITAKEKLIIEKNTRLNALEKEVGAVKENSLQLRLQLSELEVQLGAEKELNQRLTSDNTLRLNQNTPSDAALQVERLNEEMNRMSEQLLEEQKINNELKIQVEAINNLSTKTINHSNTSNGPAVTVENNGN
ncbi:hypothetical protein QE152_g10940 [Popillia japonica]|uniref:Ribosome-binding protein 1 n=1 Tax=Popillia japonica TaxID=7064 RepID=A0AAW1LT08_POPJA